MAQPPLWKRLGFETEWKYRVAKAQEQGFSQAQYDQERRQQKARAEGFTSASSRKRFQAQMREKKPTGNEDYFYRLTFQSEERKKLRDVQLRRYGISAKRFDEIRAENRKWSAANNGTRWAAIQLYDEFIDDRENDWSDDRIGYILSYHAAMVNKATNYESLPNNPKHYKNGPIGRKKMEKNRKGASQFFYLVKYAKVLSVDEFEARYGRGAIVAADGKLPTP